jgi:hypothetical protein
MPAVHFTNLLIVVGVGLLAPLVLGFFPRFRLPAIVLEIVLGIVIGPSGLGWVKPDLPVSILALVGLAFLLFLSGLEIDVARLRGRVLKLTALGFVVSFMIAIVLGLGLKAGGFVRSPLFVAIVLVATSLGVIVPVLKDSGNISSSFAWWWSPLPPRRLPLKCSRASAWLPIGCGRTCGRAERPPHCVRTDARHLWQTILTTCPPHVRLARLPSAC